MRAELRTPDVVLAAIESAGVPFVGGVAVGAVALGANALAIAGARAWFHRRAGGVARVRVFQPCHVAPDRARNGFERRVLRRGRGAGHRTRRAAGAMADDDTHRIENIAIAIFSNASAVMTPLLMDYVVDATEGDSAGFKGWVDPFCDIAGGVLVAAA